MIRSDRDRGGWFDWAPDAGTLLLSTIIGLGVFVGVLLYGPEPAKPPAPPPGPESNRSWVRGNAIDAISRGEDGRAIGVLLEQLEVDPEFGWGWRIVYQLASRDEAYAEERETARARLIDLPRGSSSDWEWRWDRRTRGLSLMLQGREEEARATLARSIERVKEDDSIGDGLALFLEGAMLAIGNQPDEAMDVLERMVEGGEYINSAWLERTPDLDSLRGLPRFAALLDRARALEGEVARSLDAERRAREEGEPKSEEGP